MQQAADFGAECDALAALLKARGDGRWDEPTQFKGWTVNDVLVHLHHWNAAADLSLTDPDAARAKLTNAFEEIGKGSIRSYENSVIAERGPALFDAWQALASDMSRRWAGIDPKTRLAWVGSSMSARSSISARQMETWAHGHEIFDLFGETRIETDRIRNIVILGVNTFGFSYTNRGAEVPDAMPRLRLTAPSGEIWDFGDSDSADLIEGSAVAFAQVVTQTRSVADTDLRMTGPVAEDWMTNAQCFAGTPNPTPAPGSRFRTGG